MLTGDDTHRSNKRSGTAQVTTEKTAGGGQVAGMKTLHSDRLQVVCIQPRLFGCNLAQGLHNVMCSTKTATAGRR